MHSILAALFVFLAFYTHQPRGSDSDAANPANGIHSENSGRPAQQVVRRRSEPLVIRDKSGLVIENLEITAAKGNAIEIWNSENIVVRNCLIRNAVGEAVYIHGSHRIEISENYFENVRTGVNAVASQSIRILHNECKNVVGPMPRGQMVQFNNVTGTDNYIGFNYAINLPGESHPEDVISLYESSGTAESPLEVVGNYINGGGPSSSGGGIMCGDGKKISEHILVHGNVLINPGQYGIAIVSGRNILVTKNRVFSRRQPWSNVGLYSWSKGAEVYENNEMSFNEVSWTNKEGRPNHGWLSPEVVPKIRNWNTNRFGTRLVTELLPAPEGCGITAWESPMVRP